MGKTAPFLGIYQNKDEILLYFSQEKDGKKQLKVASSKNGREFSNEVADAIVLDNKQDHESEFDWKSFRISSQIDQFFLTYRSNSSEDSNLNGAISPDLLNWETTGNVDHITETGAVVPNYKHRQQSIMYFGEKSIRIAYSAYLYQWKSFEKPLLEPREKSFDSGDLEVLNAYIQDEDILLVYSSKNGDNGSYAIGAAIFDKNDPTELIWRSESPIWEVGEEFKYESLLPFGSAVVEDELLIYWLANGTEVLVVSCPLPNSKSDQHKKSFTALLKKAENNPIIAPDPNHPWESRATFNPAAVFEDGKVHFIYRALGESDLSVLGYATSTDGTTIDERSDEPIYIPREPFETPGQNVFKTFADHFASGGGYGGVEDPRITKVDNKFYMTYVAFDGANPPRVALTSIDTQDFLNRKWDKWEKPKLISSPGMVNKNAVIFPEKINGKYVVFHRIYPNILVDYVDDLNFDKHLQGQYFIPPRKKYWDSKKIGAGAPPIKTDDGWLFIYQSVGFADPHKYKIGAMLLDLENPTKVLHRTSTPIVEPVESYENEGFKSGVVYPCGAVTMNNKLHVYYGGADTVVCAASVELDRFLYEMKNDREPKLSKITNISLN